MMRLGCPSLTALRADARILDPACPNRPCDNMMRVNCELMLAFVLPCLVYAFLSVILVTRPVISEDLLMILFLPFSALSKPLFASPEI